jgi:diacylglycerol kinase family enzyme
LNNSNKIKGTIDTDDIVGAEHILGKKGGFRVHFFIKGRGTGASALQRQPQALDFHCSKEAANMADKWVEMIQELVRWQARAPPVADKRRIKVVVNPHSGKRQARRIWEQRVKKYFDLGNFEYEVEETTYSGHAIDMGKEYSPDDGFEALVFIGGDGTLGEFMNGLLTRPEHEWREIVAGTPISLISAGTQNAFGSGVGIPTAEASVYCIIKRKIRPLDVITATASADPEKVHYSYCGLGWGVAGDIAAESERYRWMGTSRYAFLKVKRAALLPKKHTGRVRYVRTEPQPELCKYDDIRDAGALDQFEMEEGNVYDFDRNSGMQRKSWGGYGGAVHSPASHTRYPEEMWTEETGRYMVVGVVNIAPDGKYAHPSDGNLDLILTRKGNIFRELQLGILYLMGKELKSPLVSYIKVKAVEIQPDEPTDAMNNDGEVLSGGPWRMEVIPSLFKALSEK